MIESPVGKEPGMGFWTVHEVMISIKEAFEFEKEQFGELGRKAYKVFQRWVKMPKKRVRQVIEVEVDHNYAA